MRRDLRWLLTLPLTLTGVEGAHALANALVGAPDGELFETPASGAGVVPLAAVALVVLVAAALAARVAGLWRGDARGRRLLALPFAALPPLAFVLLESGEAIAGGGVGLHTFAAPSFLVGLALQLPFALAAYAVARLLLRVADGLHALLVRRHPAASRRPPQLRPPAGDRHDSQERSSTVRGRAPPVAVPAG